MEFREKIGVNAVRFALTVFASSVAIAAYAQETTATTDTKAQRIVITGSNISRIDAEGPTPVEVIKRSEIEKTGASTVIELLSKLPSMAVALDGTSSSSFASGAASAQLRGLDAKYVLILLNGRRLANYGFADGAENSFVDLNSLPLAAIDSVEILRDGASAIYGSDAVAGVINFKTRKNYQGVEATANVGSNQKGDGGTYNTSITAGFGDLDADGQNLLVTVDAFKRNPLWSNLHDYYSNPDHRRFGGTDGTTTNLYRGSLRDYDNGEPGYAIPGCHGTVGVSSNTGDNVCFTNPATQLSPHIERFGISSIYTKKLNNTDELFAEAGVTTSKTTVQQGFPSFSSSFIGATAGSTNPGLNSLPGPSADGSLQGFTPGDRLQIFRAIYEAGQKVETINSDTIRLVGGWRGLVGQWESEAAISLNQNHIDDSTTKQVLKDVSNASLQAGILGKAGGYDPFVDQNPASVVNPMLTSTLRRATSRLETAEWKMSKADLFNIANGPVGFAWGTQFSHESIDDVPDAVMAAGNIANYGATSSKASRSVYSAYGEFDIPVLKTLEMQLALRGDHYSDFGNSVNPKIALAWRPTDKILVRGSATTSFKAPTLPEISSTTTAYVTVADWARCGPLGYVGAQCSYSPKAYLQGNPNLKAETADNYSFGIVLQPVKDFTASIDWFGINQKDTIQSLDAQYLLDNEDKIPGFAALVGRDPRNYALEAKHPGLNKGRINSVTLPYTNVGKTQIQGVDIDLNYGLKLGSFGKLTFREVNTYFLEYKQSVAPGEDPTSRLDGINHPKWSNSFRLGYEVDKYEGSITARTYASTLNIDDPTHSQDPAITNARIPSYTVWDMNFNAKLKKDLSVNFGINNAFDKPPVYSNAASEDGAVQSKNDLVGRYFYVNMRYTFK
ncbi:TonB-dependent receptor plug domain-containing protein [Undibacterium sp. MH2W]|uniref:TonB-dependent receptor plug domain-containing protein n=1 Tax=Undibacterium sp. MH2W TaxID=3413044 RepID=UPI003BF1E72A